MVAAQDWLGVARGSVVPARISARAHASGELDPRLFPPARSGVASGCHGALRRRGQYLDAYLLIAIQLALTVWPSAAAPSRWHATSVRPRGARSLRSLSV